MFTGSLFCSYFSDGHSVGALAIRVIELLSLFNRGDNR